MPQLSLFESPDTVVVDDHSGRIAYQPQLVTARVADGWFAELRQAVPWKAERRWMYDREVDVPRLTAHFDLAREELAGGPVPATILKAAQVVIAKTAVPFNSVGLNLYRDGRDSVASHNDHLDEIVEGFPIALLSLGATRRMNIRAKAPPRRVLNLDLESGSLLMMSYATQLHYTHGIPKTREPAAARVEMIDRYALRSPVLPSSGER